MKLFLVGLPDSIHTVRWINQIGDQGWKIYLYPSRDGLWTHPELKNVEVLVSWIHFFKIADRFGLGRVFFLGNILRIKWTQKFSPKFHVKRLARNINRIEPDIIHSLETQGAGYLLAEALPLFKRKYPWWHTNWGSDLFIYGRLEEHKARIRNVLTQCNYYSCECQRDVQLAKELGFRGTVFSVYPNTGGFDLTKLEMLREKAFPTSQRKLILLKGYQGWAGRSLVAIRALERCSDILAGYELAIFSNVTSEDVKIASELLSLRSGIKVRLIPNKTPHFRILELQSMARIYIGLSIGDGISTSLLESMAMGSFPIQSCTACANEWMENARGGFIVPPEDPEVVEIAIREALTNDVLVDTAAEKNYETIRNRADFFDLKRKTINSYQFIYNERK